MFRNSNKIHACLFIVAAIAVNIVGRLLSTELNMPLWLDSVGTMFAAYVLGPIWGAAVGAALNVSVSIINASPYHLAYALVSVIIGIIAGTAFRRGVLEKFLYTATLAYGMSLLSAVICLLINFAFFDGRTGNAWGNAIIVFYESFGLPHGLCVAIGEFYLEFPDKAISLLIVYMSVRLYRQHREGTLDPREWPRSAVLSSRLALRRAHRIASRLWAKITLVLLLLLPLGMLYVEEPASIAAQDAGNYSHYIQRTYDNTDGMPEGRANDIAMTEDGILWVATYGGLYRYNGNEFRFMDKFSSARSIACLYVDDEDRLWIGTNDNGVSLCIGENITQVFTQADGLGSDSVQDIVKGSGNRYYVATTGGLSVLELSDTLTLLGNVPGIASAESLSVNRNGLVAAVGLRGTLYLVRDDKVIYRLIPGLNANGSDFTSCAFDRLGNLYVGTSNGDIYKYQVAGDSLVEVQRIACGTDRINAIRVTDGGRLFVCGDDGIGWIDTAGIFHAIRTEGFANSVENMLVDFQDGLWFVSSRLGLMHMSKSVFWDIYEEAGLPEKMVNTVRIWQGNMYVGTDSGLDVLNGDTYTPVTVPLSGELQGVRIRSIIEDKSGHLWISTYVKGLYELLPDGTSRHYTTANGLSGNVLRSVTELSDGTIVAFGNDGLNFIKDGKVTGTLGAEQGMPNFKVLCAMEMADGSILAGTDGNGLARIRDGKVVRVYSKQDGLSSEVIMRLVRDTAGKGVFVLTGSGLCYMDNADEDDSDIRLLDKFPYYNNLDLLQVQDNLIFVLASVGIFVVDREELLSGRDLDYVLMDAQNGLAKRITPNSWNYVDGQGNFFMSTESGVMCMNLNGYKDSIGDYRINIRSVTVDGVEYLIGSDRKITCPPGGANRVEILPEVVNYAPEKPYIRMYLEGFDQEPRVVSQHELSRQVYINLPAGKYLFHADILDSSGKRVLGSYVLRLELDQELHETWLFRAYAAFIAALTIVYLAWLIFYWRSRKKMEQAQKKFEMAHATVLTIVRSVEAKDDKTGQHSARVAAYAVQIAKRLGYDQKQCDDLKEIAMLHDIGKIGIPDSILNKPSRLTKDEWAIMQSHVVKGAKILRQFTLIKDVADGALYHHERYDGNGYIHGLKGEEIPLNARIIGIADAFDAMTSNRSYRDSMEMEYVIKELRRCRGTQFDPLLTDIMLELLESGVIDVEKMQRNTTNT